MKEGVEERSAQCSQVSLSSEGEQSSRPIKGAGAMLFTLPFILQHDRRSHSRLSDQSLPGVGYATLTLGESGADGWLSRAGQAAF